MSKDGRPRNFPGGAVHPNHALPRINAPDCGEFLIVQHYHDVLRLRWQRHFAAKSVDGVPAAYPGGQGKAS